MTSEVAPRVSSDTEAMATATQFRTFMMVLFLKMIGIMPSTSTSSSPRPLAPPLPAEQPEELPNTRVSSAGSEQVPAASSQARPVPQSPSPRHSTHRAAAASQSRPAVSQAPHPNSHVVDVSPVTHVHPITGQSVSLAHPHEAVRTSQRGPSTFPTQSSSPRHSTQRRLASSHSRPAAVQPSHPNTQRFTSPAALHHHPIPPQSTSASHSPHRCVAATHTDRFRLKSQSPSVAHSRHAWLASSHGRPSALH